MTFSENKYCTNCGNKLTDSSKFCSSCGYKVTPNSITEENYLNLYINSDEKAHWYKNSFNKYEAYGVSEISWSWYAFFFGPFYLAYRKCYYEAIVFWAIFLLFKFNIVLIFIAPFIAGAFFPYYIYLRYSSVINRVKLMTSDKRLDYLKEVGGVDKIALFFIGFLVLIEPIVFFSIKFLVEFFKILF